MYNKIFDKIVFSNTPPSNTNVLWIYPIDSKHYDIRMYTIVQQDEYTSIKKWTSIGITDIAKTELTTDFWYVGFLENIPTFDLEEINNIPVQRHEEYSTTVKDMPIIDRLLVSYVFDELDKKNLYFDTRQIDPEKDLDKYYTVVIPDYYKINSIIKENYYEGDKTYQKDVLTEGEYLISSTLNFNGKQYTLLTLKFYDELTPFQITTNVVRDLVVSDYIVQECGNSVDRIMSQQAVTKELDVLKDILSNVDVPNLATVAKTGDYNDLLNKPVIPEIPEMPDLSGFQTVEQALEQYNELYNNDTAIAKEVSNLMIRTDAVEQNIDKNTQNIESKQDAEVVLAYQNIEDMNLVDNNIILENNNKVIIIRSISLDFTITIKGNSSIIFTIGEIVPQITFTPLSWIKSPQFEPNSSYMLAFDYIDKVMDNGIHAFQITGMWVKIEEY